MDELELLWGRSPAMADLLATVRRFIQRVGAGAQLPSILILGETGTGKTRLAEALHRISPRKRGPYVDCRLESMPESLAESELFGYERGAFTGAVAPRRGLFQSAHGGTLFLDEIGVASPALQVKLLKAVEERVVRRVGSTRSEPFDAWIISATNEDLDTAIAERKFREDLYHRLAVMTLSLPPLRARGQDILLLARRFLDDTATDYGLGRMTFTRAAEAKIAQYAWPGNVRELANTIERAALLTESTIIDADALDLRRGRGESGPPRQSGSPPPKADAAAPGHAGTAQREPSSSSLDDAVRVRLQDALDQHGGNISHAALELGIARNTLRAHIQRLGLRTAAPGTAPRRRQRAGWTPDRPLAVPPAGAEASASIWRAETSASMSGEIGALEGGGRSPAPPAARVEAGAPSPAPPPPRADADVAVVPPPALEPARPRLFAWERQLIAFVSVALEPPVGVIAAQLAPTLGEIIDKLEPFGGRIRDVRPHGVTALFGIEPLDDFARRAANAAVAALKAVERAAAGPLAELVGRAALHVEECVVARARGAVGMEPEHENEARTVLDKLLALAPPGAAMVSAAAARFLERRFELAPLGADSHAFRLTRHERSGLEVGGRRLSRFVGRAPEMAALDKLLRDAESSRGQIVAIVGGAGVGKTRLIRQFLGGLAPGRAAALEGRCVSYASHSPYYPLVEMLRQTFGVEDGDSADALAGKVRAGVAALDLDEEQVASFLIHLLGVAVGGDRLAGWSPEAIRQRTVDAIRRLALSASRRRPLIIVVEDLQWIDQTSEDTLASLGDSLAMSPLVLLTTYRPGYHPPWSGRSNLTQLALGPLTDDESLTLVRSLATEEELAADLSERILARAAGVPFFIEELTRALTDDPSLARAAIPDTIQATLAARLGHLSAPDRALLQTASVIGKDVQGAVLAAVAGVIDAPLREMLGRLEQAEFLFETRAGSSPSYTFKHVLTQEVAYRGLPEEQRRVIHARAAEAIERVTPDVAAQQPEILAHHTMHGGLTVEAVGHWHRAGSLAIRRSANAEAVAHLKTALGLLQTVVPGPARSRTELGLRLTLGTALVAHRGYGAGELEETLGRLRVLAEELIDAPEVPLARFALWRFSTARADFRAAGQLADEMLAGARGGDAQAHIPASVAAGVTAFYRGRYAQAREHFDTASRLYEPPFARTQIALYGNDLGVVAQSFLGWTLALTGEADRAVSLCDGAIARARDGGHLFTLAVALNWAGLVHAERHEPAMAERLGEELLDLSREQSFGFFVALGLGLVGWARFAQGDRDRGAELLRKGLESYQAAGQRVGLRLRAHFAEALVGIGAIDEALVRLDEFLAHSRESGEAGFASELLRIQGEALWQRAAGDPQALRCLEEAVALAREQGAGMLALRAAISLVKLERERGEPVQGMAALRHAYASLVEGFDLHDARAARALLAE